MQQLPVYIPIVFSLTVIAALYFLLRATAYNKAVAVYLCLLIVLQSVAGLAGFYGADNLSYRFPVLAAPALIGIALLFITRAGRHIIDSSDLKLLTLLHVLRVPVEFVLLWLSLNNAVPEAMTFHGRNFDILSGLTAPFVYYLVFIKRSFGKKFLFIWNCLSLLFLINVVTIAVRALPAFYAANGFEQPNIAVGYFPFVLLPAFLVPAVLFATLVSFRAFSRKTAGPTV